MQFRSTLGAVALLLAGANARITGFSAPETIQAGEPFQLKMDATLITSETEWPVYMSFWTENVEPAGSIKFSSLGTYEFSDGTYIASLPINI